MGLEHRRLGARQEHARDREYAVERRMQVLLERDERDWVEAWAQAEAEQDAEDARKEAARAAIPGALPHRRTPARDPIAPGRLTMAEQIAPDRRSQRGWTPPGLVARAAASALPGGALLGAVVMRSAEHAATAAAPEAAALIARARRGGAPLDAALQAILEDALGAPLSSVRIHTGADADAAARAVGARAFAIDDDVVFRAGAYDPVRPDGQRLIAHEIAHAVQARTARTMHTGASGLSVTQPGDPVEREADAFADAFIARLHGAPLRDTPLHSAGPDAAHPALPIDSLRDTSLHGTPLHGTPLHGAPLHGAPLHGSGPDAAHPAPGIELLASRAPVREPVPQSPILRWADGPSPDGEAVEAALRPNGGEPLPPDLRAELELQFGCDLSRVRIHRDGAAQGAARALHARAFTVGEHVYFLDAALELRSPEGRALLAHELTHVVQHYQGRVALRPGFAVSRPDDPLEREAEAVGESVARGAAAPARSQMGSAIGTVGGSAAGSEASTSPGGPGAPGAASLTGFRAPAPAPGGAAHSGKLPGSPPATDALIGNVPPAAPHAAAHRPPTPAHRPAKPAAPGGAPKTAGHPPAMRPAAAHAPRKPAGHGPAGPAAPGARGPQLHPVPAAGEAATAPAAAQPGAGPPPTAADRAAARQAAAAAARELAAHGTELAAAARAVGQQVLAQIAADGNQQRQRVTAAAQTARQQVEQGIAAQRAQITARAAAEKTRASAAATAQRAQITAAAQAQRQQTAQQVTTERQAAQAAAQATRQGITQAGEAQAQRATAQTAERVARAQAITNGAAGGGDAERANAQRESATKISQRAVEGVQANGREMVQAAHDTAAAMASEVDGKLADYNHNLDQCAAETHQHIAKLETDATGELETMAHQAEQNLTALATEAQTALDGRKQAAFTAIERASAESSAHLSQSVTSVTAQASAQIEQQCGQLAAAGGQARTVFDHVEHPEQVATAAAAARAQLDQAAAGIRQAIQGVHTSTATELAASGDAAATGLTTAGTSGAADAAAAGAAVLDKLSTAGGGAVRSITDRAGKARSTLTASGQTFTQQVGKARGQFTDKLRGMIGLATRTIGEKVDAGLAYQDQVVSRAQGEAQRATQQIGARYDALKSEADSRNGATAQRSWLSRAWNAVTGWIDSVRQWFLRTFGDFWGGLLFGILSALVIVAIGLAIGWVVGAIVGAIVATAEVAAIVTAVILLVGAAGIAIYARFQEFYADNPGQSAGFWRGLGLVGLGIADLTGIPYIVEGIVGQRAFGAKMNDAQRGERIGMGIVFLVTAGLATWKGIKWFRGRTPSAPPPVDPPPVDHPPVDHPPTDPVDPSRPDPNHPDPNGGRPPLDADNKVSKTKNGYRLNRKNIQNVEKIQGQPESIVEADANREALAAELAASKSNVDRVYMGQEADQFINGNQGRSMSADVVAVNKQGQFLVYEAKGMNIEHGLEQLEFTAQELGPSRVVRQTLVVPERINTPGYEVINGVLYSGGRPVLVAGKPVNIIFTTQK